MTMNAKTLGILIASFSLLPLAACQKETKETTTRISEASPPPTVVVTPPPADKADNPPPATVNVMPQAPAPEAPANTQEQPKAPQ